MSKNAKPQLAAPALKAPAVLLELHSNVGSAGRGFVLCFTSQLSKRKLRAGEGWNWALIVTHLTSGHEYPSMLTSDFMPRDYFNMGNAVTISLSVCVGV